VAEENGLLFIETSAKSAFNVEEVFKVSAEHILKSTEKESAVEEKVILDL
jgi:hypothetical protein